MRFSALSPALNLPPLSKVRCCHPKEFGRLPEGLSLHQPFSKPHYPLPHTTSLPPLSKGGGLTARHKPGYWCFLFMTRPPFFIYQTFLPSRRRDCHSTNLSKTALSHPLFVGRASACACTASYPHYPLLSTTSLPPLEKGEVLSPEKIRATTGGIAPYPHHQ